MFTQYDESQTAKCTILPVAFEGTMSFGEGCKDGSTAIINAAAQLEPFDLITKTRPMDSSIQIYQTLEAENPEQIAQDIQRVVEDQLSIGRLPIILGGDHSTPIGAVKAAAKVHTDLTVVQFDAHPDLFYSWNNSTYNHRCFGYHASKAAKLVQLGIRAADEDELAFAKENNVEQHNILFDQQKILDGLTKNVYISIDVDVLDPSVIAGTGTPEPAGMSYSQLLYIVSAIANQSNIVGLDIVEYAPRQEETAKRAESYTLAKLLYSIIAHVIKHD